MCSQCDDSNTRLKPHQSTLKVIKSVRDTAELTVIYNTDLIAHLLHDYPRVSLKSLVVGVLDKYLHGSY